MDMGGSGLHELFKVEIGYVYFCAQVAVCCECFTTYYTPLITVVCTINMQYGCMLYLPQYRPQSV